MSNSFGSQFGLSAYKTAKSMGNNKSLGKCALAVGDAFARVVGENVACNLRGHAYTWLTKMKSNLALRYWKFYKQSKDTTNLPAGSLVIWDRQQAHPYGHIEVADGNGHLCSDFIRSDKLAIYRSNPANIVPMIFIPIESDSKSSNENKLPYDVTVVATALNVRKEPRIGSYIIKTLSKGTKVKIWAIKTEVEGKTIWGKLSDGYICMQLDGKKYVDR